MIVREHENEFIMIEQDDHAHISGQLLANWSKQSFRGEHVRESVENAVHNHDYGWKTIDKQPFWNDVQKAPYTFVNFPALPKTVFYKHGIETVVRTDTYAGLLCSRHYTNFLLDDQSKEAQEFVRDEQKRQEQIIQTFTAFNGNLYDFHYGLLQFCDSLSLYLCLNEPGTTKTNEHPFFQHGIPAPNLQEVFGQDKVLSRWTDTNTITMDVFPFPKSFTVSIKQKNVSKTAISEKGLIKSYEDAPLYKHNVLLTGTELNNLI